MTTLRHTRDTEVIPCSHVDAGCTRNPCDWAHHRFTGGEHFFVNDKEVTPKEYREAFTKLPEQHRGSEN